MSLFFVSPRPPAYWGIPCNGEPQGPNHVCTDHTPGVEGVMHFKRGPVLQLEVLQYEESRDILKMYDTPEGAGPIRKLVPVDNGGMRLCARFPGGQPFPVLLLTEESVQEFGRQHLRACVEQGLLTPEQKAIFDALTPDQRKELGLE